MTENDLIGAGRTNLTSLAGALAAIADTLDGTEWNADTCDTIAGIARGEGFIVREMAVPEIIAAAMVEDCGECGQGPDGAQSAEHAAHCSLHPDNETTNAGLFAAVAERQQEKDAEQDDDMDAPQTLIARVERHIASDDDDPRDQSARLLAHYHEATPEQRAVVDSIFICLCGWSIDSMVNGRDR